MKRYIDADLLKDKTTRVNNIWNGTTNAEGKGLDEIIDDIPTADVRENVRGEWLRQDDGWYGDYYECSVCKEPFTLIDGTPQDNLYNFCPNCGADMRSKSC